MRWRPYNKTLEKECKAISKNSEKFATLHCVVKGNEISHSFKTSLYTLYNEGIVTNCIVFSVTNCIVKNIEKQESTFSYRKNGFYF